MNEGKLHLTVGVLHLLSTKEVEKATTVLTTRIYDIVHSVLAESKTTKLELEMEGLEIMNDDPYMTDVVYAKVSDHDEILQSNYAKYALFCKSQKNFQKYQTQFLMNL